MTQLDLSEARGRWDELLARARGGEEIVLAEKGKPVARLGPAGSDTSGARVFGEFAGKVRMSEDFAAPLSGAELAEWET